VALETAGCVEQSGGSQTNRLITHMHSSTIRSVRSQC